MKKQFIFSLLLGFALVGMPEALLAQRNSSRSGESKDSQPTRTQSNRSDTATRPPATRPTPAATQTTRPTPAATQTTRPTPTATQTTRPTPTATQTSRPTPAATQTSRPTPTATQTSRPTPTAERPTSVPVRPVRPNAPTEQPAAIETSALGAERPTTRPTPTTERPTTRPTPTVERPTSVPVRPVRPNAPTEQPAAAIETSTLGAERPTARPTPTTERPTTRPTPTAERPTSGSARPMRPNAATEQPAAAIETSTLGAAQDAAAATGNYSTTSDISRAGANDSRGSIRPSGAPGGRNRVDLRDQSVSRTIVNNVNVRVQNNYFATPRYSSIFDDRWYRNYPSAWYRPLPPRVWWQPAPAWGSTWRWYSAGFFTGYLVNSALTPIPYHYGTNVYYANDMVYVNGEPYISADVYYAQAAEIAARGNPQPIHIVVQTETVKAEPPQEEWMPVGTFAVLKDPEVTETSIIVQLATNKSGHIAGNMINMQTDETLPIYGAVDPETQRVAMRVEGRDEIAECGLWNLTQDTLAVLLHVDDKTTEERTFVRLSDPDQEELAP